MPLPDFAVPGQGQKAPIPGAGMPINPVEIIQKNHLMLSEREKLKRATVVYGQHAPLRMLLERNALSQHRRLPGLKSNLVGLCESMGIDDDIEPEDMFYQQQECPTLRTGMGDLHSMMEERLGMHDDITEVTNLNLTSDAFKSISHSMAL